MSRIIDRDEKYYGRLEVFGRAANKYDRRGRKIICWWCLCDCGTFVVVSSKQLSNGTRSCGCLNRKHGQVNTRLYHIWEGIKNRCYNARSKAYKHYGGRGITVCDEWRESFTSFREWAMSNGYADGLTIDRTDNDGGYLPENCRWSTRKEQARNRSNTLRFGSVPLVEIAELTGISYKTLSGRLKRNPDTSYEHLTRPPKKRF